MSVVIGALTLTAEKWKRVVDPEEVFTSDDEGAKRLYRDLAKRWHPDHGGDKDVFAKITALYDERERKLKDGTWSIASKVILEAKSGVTHVLKYLRSHAFPIGRMYVGNENVVFLVDAKHKALWSNGVANSSLFSYGDAKMREEVSRYLPQGVDAYELKDGRFALRMAKTPDLILLRDVLDHFKGEVPEKHAAWIGSSLQNLACYLSWAGIVHMDISPDTYFISPQFHSGALLGGWWFATKEGKAVRTVPRRTETYLPFEVRNSKRAVGLIDQELIRALGREIRGDITGLSLKGDPVVEWLRRPAPDEKARETYADWLKVLEKKFGKRRFTELKLTAEDVYGHSA